MRGEHAELSETSVTSETRAAQILRIKNSTTTEQVLWIEPLGDRELLQSNALYELIGTDEFGKMEIGPCENGFADHGWVRKVVVLRGNGNDLVE